MNGSRTCWPLLQIQSALLRIYGVLLQIQGFFCGYRGLCFVFMFRIYGAFVSTEDLYLPKELHEHLKEPSISTEDLYVPHIYKYSGE